MAKGAGIQLAELKFGVNSQGDLVVILAEFPLEMRAPLRAMLTTIVEMGVGAMNAVIAEEVARAGVPIPLGPKSTNNSTKD